MKLFEPLDSIGGPNYWKHPRYARIAVLVIVVFTLIIWILQGFDSGIAEYGTSLHWSVFVIYGTCFIGMSLYYEDIGIYGSKNNAYSLVVTLFSLAVFEWYWMAGYYFIRGETWILANNLSHIIPNIILTIPGIAMLYRYRKKLDINPNALILFALGAIWYLWGFPQTSYPQMNGTSIYIENNLIHLMNIIVKAAYTTGVASIFMVKPEWMSH